MSYFNDFRTLMQRIGLRKPVLVLSKPTAWPSPSSSADNPPPPPSAIRCWRLAGLPNTVLFASFLAIKKAVGANALLGLHLSAWSWLIGNGDPTRPLQEEVDAGYLFFSSSASRQRNWADPDFVPTPAIATPILRHQGQPDHWWMADTAPLTT